MSARVLHVLPLDLERGAQRYVQALRQHAEGRPHHHRVLTLFQSTAEVANADVRLNMPRAMASAFGFDPRVAWQLRRALRQLAADVVIAHGSEPLKYVTAARWRGPLAYYKIGVANLDDAPVRRRIHRALLTTPDLVLAVSEDCRAEAEGEFAVPADRLRVVPNARDPQVYAPPSKPRHRDVARLVFVGHLNDAKRPLDFINSVRRLRSDDVPVRGVVVGGGPLLERVEENSAGAGVDVLGPRSDVPALLRDADILLFTGSPLEGMPGVFIEAGLCGVPVVSTDVPGARDVIEHGVTGYIVPADRPEEADRFVAALVRNRSLREAMGRAARERCVRDFSLEASVTLWAAVIDELVQVHRPQSVVDRA